MTAVVVVVVTLVMGDNGPSLVGEAVGGLEEIGDGCICGSRS